MRPDRACEKRTYTSVRLNVANRLLGVDCIETYVEERKNSPASRLPAGITRVYILVPLQLELN